MKFSGRYPGGSEDFSVTIDQKDIQYIYENEKEVHVVTRFSSSEYGNLKWVFIKESFRKTK